MRSAPNPPRPRPAHYQRRQTVKSEAGFNDAKAKAECRMLEVLPINDVALDNLEEVYKQAVEKGKVQASPVTEVELRAEKPVNYGELHRTYESAVRSRLVYTPPRGSIALSLLGQEIKRQ